MIKTYTSLHATYTDERFLRFINPENIKTIIEGGSRDLIDALFLENYFRHATIHSFECNDEAYDICNQALKQSNGRILLNKKAMYNENKNITFYAFDHNKTQEHDIGVSSLYQHIDQRSVPQKSTTVSGIRLDTYCHDNNIESIDYLCLDVQGAEDIVLQGLGSFLNTIKYIVLEDDSHTYKEANPINRSLLKDFTLANTICNDSLYIRNDIR